MSKRFGAAFCENELLAKRVLMHIGGPARYFVSVKNEDDVRDAVACAQQHAIPFFVLGGGSNTIISDGGWDGLVIAMTNRDVTIEETRVFAGAGALSTLVARQCAEAGLGGFSWAISLPGTVGGAVRGNAGCFGGETKDVVHAVRVFHEGNFVDIPASELHFAYRHSIFKEAPYAHAIIFSVTLDLVRSTPQQERVILDACLLKRKKSQPLGVSSAGCMFKNVEFSHTSDLSQLQQHVAVPQEMLEKRCIPAGWLIDQLGLKGLTVGDAQVSEMHGNFLLNKGHATAGDIARLVRQVKTAVHDRYDVVLEEEVCFLGM